MNRSLTCKRKNPHRSESWQVQQEQPETEKTQKKERKKERKTRPKTSNLTLSPWDAIRNNSENAVVETPIHKIRRFSLCLCLSVSLSLPVLSVSLSLCVCLSVSLSVHPPQTHNTTTTQFLPSQHTSTTPIQ